MYFPYLATDCSCRKFSKTPASSAINVKLPNDHIMAQSHHGSVSYLRYATLSKSFKKISWPYLQTSPFFGTTCWCWLQVPWRQHNLDAHTSTPPRFNCKKMLLLSHVSLISNKPTLCPAKNKPIQLLFSSCQLYLIISTQFPFCKQCLLHDNKTRLSHVLPPCCFFSCP